MHCFRKAVRHVPVASWEGCQPHTTPHLFKRHILYAISGVSWGRGGHGGGGRVGAGAGAGAVVWESWGAIHHEPWLTVTARPLAPSALWAAWHAPLANLAAPLAGVLSCINLSHACCGGGRGAWGGRRNRAEEENRLALDCEPGPGGFRFIWKPAQPHCLPTQPPHSNAPPLLPHCGEKGISQNWQVQSGWDPRECVGRVLAGWVLWVWLRSF